ncbi:hypothetical protein EOPP23_09080 [Endozoicomonas sp. OPT23]|nr:hypothetical protein [Endozoicomonas sp. OPT23]
MAEVTGMIYKPEWLAVGSTKVIPTSESATIKLKADLKDRVFRKVRLKVADGSLKVKEVKIYMSDGHVLKSGIQKVIKNGMATRELIIPDHRRSIKKIVVLFKAPMTQSVMISAIGQELIEEYPES